MRISRRVSRGIATCALFASLLMLAGTACAGDTEPTREIQATDLLNMIRAERGKVVVVNFFASWCPPCKEEIPELIALRGREDAEQMTLIGVSVDEDPKALEVMRGKTAFNYPVFRGIGDLPSVFAISSIPRLLIYDKSGALVIDHVGLADPAALEAKIAELKGR